MGKNFLRAYMRQPGGEAGQPLEFVASTPNKGRDNIVIKQDGWELGNYLKNPVVLWVHDYYRAPIGRAEVALEGGQLVCRITFDQGDAFAVDIERKYREGFLNTVSVGWDTIESERSQEEGVWMTVTKAELIDISAVPVPGDPDALIRRQYQALKDIVYNGEQTNGEDE